VQDQQFSLNANFHSNRQGDRRECRANASGISQLDISSAFWSETSYRLVLMHEKEEQTIDDLRTFGVRQIDGLGCPVF
jgi:hypothetical protein